MDDRIEQLELENEALARANVKLNARLHDLEVRDTILPPQTRRSYRGQANPAGGAGKVYQQSVQSPADVAKRQPGKQYKEVV